MCQTLLSLAQFTSLYHCCVLMLTCCSVWCNLVTNQLGVFWFWHDCFDVYSWITSLIGFCWCWLVCVDVDRFVLMLTGLCLTGLCWYWLVCVDVDRFVLMFTGLCWCWQLCVDVDMYCACSHNNKTGRWLTPFRSVWHPAREDVFFVGSMKSPRRVSSFSLCVSVFMCVNVSECVCVFNSFDLFCASNYCCFRNKGLKI